MAQPNGLKWTRIQLLAVFVAITILPAGLAAWLAWSLLQQDIVLAREQLRQIRERRADEVVQRVWGEIEGLAQSTRSLPAGTACARGTTLAYSTQPRPLPEAGPEVFAAGERAEYRADGLGEAIAIYRKLTVSRSTAVRAGAWLRLGRTLRKVGMRDEALEAYRRLREMEGAAAGGAPAAVAGQWAICRIYEEVNRTAELRVEGERLEALLKVAADHLERDIYESYAEDAARWSGKPRPVLREALAEAALARSSPAGSGRFRGQLITWVTIQDRTLLLTEREAAGLLPADVVRVRFAARATQDEALRRAADTGLPWTIAVGLVDPAKEEQAFTIRRRLLYTLLGMVGFLGFGGGYWGWRLIRRELALAQMQADLVAAVSHEFRTPLTSMRQVSAALSEGRVGDEVRRQAYYQALARATERLHRMVETLLDFARIESNAMQYRMAPLDLSALVAGTAGDFASEAAAKGFTVHTEVPDQEVEVKGDAEALRRALWNLLDNAMKYSGDCREAWVILSHNGQEASLKVTDRGIGIPREEQPEVFRKFFRGSEPRKSHIRGTGIGLAMLSHIVRAHGGTVTLESMPGEGSTFTIQLPVEG